MTKAGKWIAPLLFGAGAVIWLGWLGSSALQSLAVAARGFSVVGWAAITVIIYILIRNSIIVTPTAHADVVLFFKKPTGRILKNGIHLILPFVCSVRRVSLELAHTPINETFFSVNNVEVIVRGSAQWIPDETHLHDIFITRSEDAITKGLVDAVHAELGKIAGLHGAELYIKGREVIELLINDVLRLDPDNVLYPLPDKAGPERFNCCFGHSDTDAEKAKAKAAKQKILDALKSEAILADQLSAVEKLYGINIIRFALADIDFSESMREALELEKQTERRLAAQALQRDAAVLGAKRLKDELGLEGREAINAEQVIQGQATKEVHSYEGVGGTVPLLHLGGERQKSSEGEKGSPGGKKLIKPS